VDPDFSDLLREFSAAGVKYLLVGAHALAFHAEPRATGDLDVWVANDEENAQRVWAALTRFGAPMDKDLADVEALLRAHPEDRE
jgi:hypothetical protein